LIRIVVRRSDEWIATLQATVYRTERLIVPDV
jgi:hypothetical protein